MPRLRLGSDDVRPQARSSVRSHTTIDVHQALRAAEALLPEWDVDPRWQALIALGEFVERATRNRAWSSSSGGAAASTRSCVEAWQRASSSIYSSATSPAPSRESKHALGPIPSSPTASPDVGPSGRPRSLRTASDSRPSSRRWVRSNVASQLTRGQRTASTARRLDDLRLQLGLGVSRCQVLVGR